MVTYQINVKHDITIQLLIQGLNSSYIIVTIMSTILGSCTVFTIIILELFFEVPIVCVFSVHPKASNN